MHRNVQYVFKIFGILTDIMILLWYTDVIITYDKYYILLKNKTFSLSTFPHPSKYSLQSLNQLPLTDNTPHTDS